VFAEELMVRCAVPLAEGRSADRVSSHGSKSAPMLQNFGRNFRSRHTVQNPRQCYNILYEKIDENAARFKKIKTFQKLFYQKTFFALHR
jgi:hypothetical protein